MKMDKKEKVISIAREMYEDEVMCAKLEEVLENLKSSKVSIDYENNN